MLLSATRWVWLPRSRNQLSEDICIPSNSVKLFFRTQWEGLCDPPYCPLRCLVQRMAHTVFTPLPHPLYCRAQFRLSSAFFRPIAMAPRLIALSLPSAETSLWAEGLKTPVLILHNDSPFLFFGCAVFVALGAFSSCGEQGFLFLVLCGLLIAVASRCRAQAPESLGFSNCGKQAQ